MSARKRHTTRHPGVYYRLLDESDPTSQRRYIVAFTDSERRQRTETLPLGATLQDAVARKQEIGFRKKSGERIVRTRMDVAQLLDAWLENRKPSLPAKTITVYQWAIDKHLEPKLGRIRVTDLSPSDVAKFISELDMKAWSVKKVLTPLSGAYRHAVREGWVTSSPVTKLLPHERPKSDQREMRCMERDEIALLLKTAGRKGHGWNASLWKPLFTTLVFTGMRPSEALRLSWDDIDHARGVICVRQSKTAAGVREVMMMDTVRLALLEMRMAQPPGTECVFVNGAGNSPAVEDCRVALRATEKKAGLPDYTLYELRHTFASILIAQKETLPFIAEQMGHANPSVTLSTYAHLFEKSSAVDAARQRLQESFGGLV